MEKGFGLTIGNCLRRILLSALPGAAITNVKFAEGVKHEFTAIPHVKEDVTEIILNLKCVAIKTASVDKNFKKNVKLFKEGPGVVTARDISGDAEIEILNPDQYICTLDDGAVLDMELTIGRGRGYKGSRVQQDGHYRQYPDRQYLHACQESELQRRGDACGTER